MKPFTEDMAQRWERVLANDFVSEADRAALHEKFTALAEELGMRPRDTQEAIARAQAIVGVARGLNIPSFLTEEFFVEYQRREDRLFALKTALDVAKGSVLCEQQRKYVFQLLTREAERPKTLSRNSKKRGRD